MTLSLRFLFVNCYFHQKVWQLQARAFFSPSLDDNPHQNAFYPTITRPISHHLYVAVLMPSFLFRLQDRRTGVTFGPADTWNKPGFHWDFLDVLDGVISEEFCAPSTQLSVTKARAMSPTLGLPTSRDEVDVRLEVPGWKCQDGVENGEERCAGNHGNPRPNLTSELASTWSKRLLAN